MRKLFEKLRRDLEAFIEQRDDFILLVSCGDNDFAFVLQMLGEIEQATGTDCFLTFPDAFVEAGSFVNSAIERLRTECQTAGDWLAEQGRDPLPSMHSGIGDSKRPAADRLREAIDYARSLVPPGKGNRLVWAMVPMTIGDWPRYLELIEKLVPWKGIEPWMRGVRLVLRSSVDADKLAPRLASAPRVRRTQFEFGPAQMDSALRDQMADETQPLEQRMIALLSLAVIDYGHDRPQDAIDKYNHLLGHYQHTKNPLMQAVVLNGLGDVEQRRNQLDKAQHWYECAVEPATEAKHGVILASIVRGLGDVAFKKGQFVEAEQYFDQLDKLTQATLDAECKARALEWRGLSQEKQKAYEKAVESWEIAVDLCRKIGMPAPHKANLEHLARVFRQLKKRDRLAAVEAELKELE